VRFDSHSHSSIHPSRSLFSQFIAIFKGIVIDQKNRHFPNRVHWH
jgi:hypothetical protein